MRCLLVLTWLVVGCGGAAVRVDHDPAAEFGSLRTFDLMPGGSGLDDERLDVETVERVIAAAVVRTLEAKGYRRVTDGSADFMIGSHAALEAALDVRRMNTGYRYAPGWGWSHWGVHQGPALLLDPSSTSGGATETREYYDEGTLVLDVMVTETRRLIWRAAIHRRIDFNALEYEREERIQRAIADILDEFPP